MRFRIQFATDLPTDTVNKTQELSALPQELATLPQELGHKTQEFKQPLCVELSDLSPDELSALEMIAAPIREKGRVRPELMSGIVLQLCKGRFLGVRVLSHLLSRDAADLSRRVLNPLVKTELLRRAFPRPNDPRQAYTSNNILTEKKHKA